MSQMLTKPIDKTGVSAEIQRLKRRDSMRNLLARIPLWVLVGLLLVVVIYPLIWLLLSSFKTSDEFSTGAFWSLPAGLDWQNYSLAWTSGMNVYFLNSLLTVFPSLFLVLVLQIGRFIA